MVLPGIVRVLGAAGLLPCFALLLRTWENPRETGPNRTFIGAELRGSLGWIGSVAEGWSRQISSAEGPDDSFWGFHIGFGI